MRTLGRWWWRQDWYSICSAHYRHDADCDLCQTGYWHNHWMGCIQHVIYKVAPQACCWWANRPGSASRKRIEGWFPKLKGS